MNLYKLFNTSLLLLAPLVGACSGDLLPEEEIATAIARRDTGDAPDVALKITDIKLTAATLQATVTYSGTDIKRRGFVYSTTNALPEQDADDCTTVLSISSTAKFSELITSLTTGQTYYARAFVMLQDGSTFYSPAVTFTPDYICSEVTTLKVFNRVKRAAIVCGRFVTPGNGLRSYGVCLSEEPLPTIKDTRVAAPDTATDAGYHGIFGVFFDNLKENTMYHVRAYAITQRDTVYGNERIFKTTAGGSFNWVFNNTEGAKADGAYERILQHVDSAMYYYRNYTNLNKFLWVNYAPGTPTADCNIEGWMRVGEKSRYQWVGTIQHEMCHALGVGTASNWNSFGSPWDKQEATLTLRVMMKDMSMTIKHDGMHFWPGGINQQEEVTNGTKNDRGDYTLKQAQMLKANALIINAMRNDGLTTY